jgi:CRP/FNR family transcriptional regulator, dissimilatory nitrate respiration regulator
MDPKLLKRCSLFMGLEDDDLAQIAAVASFKRSMAGETVLLEGEPASAFYVVISGSVRVYKSSPGGREQVLRFVRPGEVFGEAAALALGTYPASAEAIQKTEFIRIDAARFRDLLADNPTLSVNVILTLFRRLQDLVNMVEELSLQDVSGRLARYLLDLWTSAQAEGRSSEIVNLDVTKGELAARLGTVSETLSRTFAKLKSRGLLAVDGRRVRLIDRRGLQAVAAGQAE